MVEVHYETPGVAGFVTNAAKINISGGHSELNVLTAHSQCIGAASR